MRKRINLNALCSSDNYKASKRVHYCSLERAHKEFSESALAMIAIASNEPSDNQEVYVVVLGSKVKMPYYRVKAAKFKWSWY